jgi:hypothetical protein
MNFTEQHINCIFMERSIIGYWNVPIMTRRNPYELLTNCKKLILSRWQITNPERCDDDTQIGYPHADRYANLIPHWQWAVFFKAVGCWIGTLLCRARSDSNLPEITPVSKLPT